MSTPGILSYWRWKKDVAEHDYAAATSYLSIRFGESRAQKVAAELRKLPVITRRANDILRATGRVPPTSPVLDYAKLSVLCWTAVFFACGWIGASSAHGGRDSDSRLLSGVLAVLMLPVSATLTFAAVVISLAQGDPRTFRTIRKTR